MYTVTVRSHMLVAHALRGGVFGPAQALHGATYVVDAAFARAELDEHNLVLDIALASRVLGEVIDPLNYQNLDELEALRGRITTSEFLARYIHDALRERLGDAFHGRLTVTLRESHVASATYEGEVF